MPWGALQYGRPALTHHREHSIFCSHPLAGRAAIRQEHNVETEIQDLGDSKPMKKISARKRSQGFKKTEREEKNNPSLLSLCCQEPAHSQYKTHKNVTASLVGMVGQRKTLRTTWDQGCLINTCKPRITREKIICEIKIKKLHKISIKITRQPLD